MDKDFIHQVVARTVIEEAVYFTKSLCFDEPNGFLNWLEENTDAVTWYEDGGVKISTDGYSSLAAYDTWIVKDRHGNLHLYRTKEEMEAQFHYLRKLE